VYRSGSVTAAAQRLHLSQPAVSAQLRAVEHENGRRLFTRVARGVVPTPEAEALASDVAPHLDALEAIRHLAGAGQAQATVHLGGPADMLAARALPSLAPVLVQRIRIRVRSGPAEPLLEALVRDDLDLVLATRRLPDARLTYEPLFTESLVLIAGQAWAARLANRDVRRYPQLLEDVPLVAYDEDLALARELWLEEFGAPPAQSPGMTVADLRAVCAAVAAGAGIAVVPRYLAADGLAQGTLVDALPTRKPIENTIHLAYRGAGLRRPGVDHVRRVLLHVAAGWQKGL
jgi:DNA-binding transcriptional LysR family regulator